MVAQHVLNSVPWQ